MGLSLERATPFKMQSASVLNIQIFPLKRKIILNLKRFFQRFWQVP